MKVAVYSIALNEAAHVVRWRKSCAEADFVLMADTGSTDGTEMYANARLNIAPFRFDDARNAALALLPPEVDVCIALDLDEILIPGWREALEKAWTPETNNAFVNFNFNGDWFMQNNRVHSRHGWRWKHPCHEALVRSIGTDVNSVEIPDFQIVHLPDTSKPRPNYLELLAWGQWEEPTSTRMLHYYGRELMFQGHHADAIERFERYLELEPERPFPAERVQTVGYLQDCRNKLMVKDDGKPRNPRRARKATALGARSIKARGNGVDGDVRTADERTDRSG